MASLANASMDFVEALRRGLDAYDAGDHERAYRVFDEALEIEPDNVWGLLWKGATAPSPADSRLWLEQALAIDPDNEHARAGLQWATAALAASGQPVESLPPSPRTTTPSVIVGEVPEEVSYSFDDEPEPARQAFGAAGAEPEEDSTDDLPDWMRGEPSPAAESGTGAEELPDWLRVTEPAQSDDDDLPDWLTGNDIGDANEELPDWMRSSEPLTADAGADDLPDWLSGDAGLAEEEADDLPDWLRDGRAPAGVAEAELPDWLSDTEEEGTSFAADGDDLALPSWLDEEPETVPPSPPQNPAPAPAATPSTSALAEAERTYQSGLLAYEENRLDDAVQDFTRTLGMNANHIEAHNYLGSVYFLQGRTDEAIHSLRRALDLDPSHTESHLNLGLIYQETGQAQEAIRMFRRYLELAPDSDIAPDVQGFIRELGG